MTDMMFSRRLGWAAAGGAGTHQGLESGASAGDAGAVETKPALSVRGHGLGGSGAQVLQRAAPAVIDREESGAVLVSQDVLCYASERLAEDEAPLP